MHYTEPCDIQTLYHVLAVVLTHEIAVLLVFSENTVTAPSFKLTSYARLHPGEDSRTL